MSNYIHGAYGKPKGINTTQRIVGKSAYEIAVDHGFVGSEEEWLESLKGKSAYEVAVDLGYEGTADEWVESIGMAMGIDLVDELADLKDDITQIVPGLTDEAKISLLNCFAHVAWENEHGSDYYDSLYAALYNDQSWMWKYAPTDGLLSDQSYITFSTNSTGWSETINNNTLRLFVPQRPGGQGSWRVLYSFGTVDGGMLKGLIKTNGLAYEATSSPTVMGARLQISNGTSGVRCAFNAYVLNGVRYLEVVYQEGTTIRSVRTNLLADEYHEVEITLDGDNQTIVIDGRLIVASNVLSTAATESHVAVQASAESAAPDGVYLDIKRLWFKENENGGDQ